MGFTRRSGFSPRRGIAVGVVAWYCFFVTPSILAQTTAVTVKPQQAEAVELVRRMVQTELAAQTQDRTHWSYQQLKQTDSKKEELRDIVQAKDGTIDRLLAVGGQPLTPEQQEKEDARVAMLTSNPDEIQKSQKAEESDAQNERALLKMLPEAFLYEDAGADVNLRKITFRPNPSFHAPNRMADVFHHMQGTMWIDRKQYRLARLEGRVIDEVKFGGGVLGHLDKGGTFTVKQAEVGPKHWDMVQLDVHMSGRALFFKTVNVRERELCSKFERIPDDMSLQQAAERLKKTTVAASNVTPAHSQAN
jgi:hypothetical protein